MTIHRTTGPENAPHVLVVTGAGLTDELSVTSRHRLDELKTTIANAVGQVLGIDQEDIGVIHARNIMPAADQEGGAANLVALGLGLKTLREEAGWSQRRMGQEARKPQSHIWSLEHGIAAQPTTIREYVWPTRRDLMILATERQAPAPAPAPAHHTRVGRGTVSSEVRERTATAFEKSYLGYLKTQHSR